MLRRVTRHDGTTIRDHHDEKDSSSSLIADLILKHFGKESFVEDKEEFQQIKEKFEKEEEESFGEVLKIAQEFMQRYIDNLEWK